MVYWIVSLLTCFSLCAQSTNTVALLSGSPIIYPIDPSARGGDIVKMVTTLTSAPFNIAGFEVLLQTLYTGSYFYAPAITNGVIPYVQSITPATNGTLLLVTYLPNGYSNPQYFVLPVEQTVAVVYYQSVPTNNPFFTTQNPQGTQPYFSMDLAMRATDIVDVVTTLLTKSPYKTPTSRVAIMTSFVSSAPRENPFNPPTGNPGVISNVQGVSLVSSPNKTLLLVSYLSPSNVVGTLVLAVEQVQQVIYLPVFR